MKDIIQRFGAAMFVPVLLFPAAGILLGLSVVLLNTSIFPFATPESTWFKVASILLKASLAIFANMSLVFALGLPIALAKMASGRAVLATLVAYLTFNYVIGGILEFWGTDLGIKYVAGETGLTTIGGVLTLDTNLVGAILIASVSVWAHNRFFNKVLPTWASVFTGTPLVVIVLFPIVVLLGIIATLTWPTIQQGIGNLQNFLVGSGVVGVWVFTFLERILIPTGLHHFIYGPVFFGPVAVDGGTVAFWIQNIQNFAANPTLLSEQFPQGGLMLTGMGKVFGTTGIAFALYKTSKPENKKMVAGLLIGATLTAILTGITEPIEFTFLFIAPYLFLIHALLSATMATVAFSLGVSGNFQTGLIDFIFQNWLPLGPNHYGTYLIQIGVGLSFTLIYYLVFKTLITKFNILTPGRGETQAKLYTKKEYEEAKNPDAKGNNHAIKTKQTNEYESQARAYLAGLGGKQNIELLTNCATRLRVKVKDLSVVESNEYFQAHGAVNVVRAGQNLQIIIGLTVPQVRVAVDEVMKAE
ncbi:alpha-glucoside-specific PTS transporter subunit IIBC [Thorsellia kenyensis]|uniref:Alpha-glucoside-specific PTS transporter subunit IIBC n=1 Tax=Thorsellia kenyensis TaxID=1549888 RepID=A0ABV6C944_9GAMM